ncbi:ATP-binding protein of ABC transporter [Planktothrix serta PCC 8927]|uniref:ATP-binding protein of ABC transporter n=1 Tax=Planktothrix serta PCC 8927 TaxID=671068 RepID=A0A7Z9BSW8_9CYAN|nr:ABC transporter ATP-binding protein [Planktothrix serta]VXD21935.1 ATP-binding protein of ABC transporter [Planktothrix serta PCC 8927]
MIEVEKLCKTYGSTVALRDVSFAVEPGAILGFLGPNGAGKTTTLRILSAYLPATSGTARIAGFDVHEQSMDVRQRIGYLPENPPLYPDMTVEGYLHFVAQIKQVVAGDRQTNVETAMAKCGLLERRKSLIRKLSKGYRQRVGIAQAIVHDPPVIVLDEPTVGLDPRQIIEVRNLIKSLAGSHTVVLSTHILPEVSMTCSQVAIINRGQIVATGTPETLMEELTGGSGYEVEVEGEITAETLVTLNQIFGVKAVEQLKTSVDSNRHWLRLSCEPDQEPAPEILARLIASDLNVYELRRTRASLEDVFLELTTQNPAPQTDSELIINTEIEEEITSEPENQESESIEVTDSPAENLKSDQEDQ